MTAAEEFALLRQVEISLDITWEDPGTDEKIRLFIANGIAYLDSKLGEPGDYLAPGFPRTLLFEYVRYARDAALDVFENNYRSQLLAMQHERQVGTLALSQRTDGENAAAEGGSPTAGTDGG